jgi:hypothetical protein
MLGTWFVEPVLVNFVSVILVSIRFGVLTSSGSASRCDGADRFLLVWFLHRERGESMGDMMHWYSSGQEKRALRQFGT